MGFGWVWPAIEGFRLLGSRTWSFFAWCLLSALTNLANLYLVSRVTALGGPRWWALLCVAVPLAVAAIQICAVWRAVLRPEDSRFAYLRVGASEARVFLLLAIPVAATYATLFFASGPWRPELVPSPLLAFGAAVVGLMIYARLSLIGPAVFDRGRFDLVGGWRLARGHVVQLLGIVLVSWGAAAICLGAWRAAQAMIVARSLSQEAMSQGSVSSLPLGVLFVVGLLLSNAATVVVLAPAAAAYRALHAHEDPVSDTFD
jgi:hypothetical protein